MKTCDHRGQICSAVALAILGLLWTALPASGETVRLESQTATVQVDTTTGRWSLLDKATGVRWPSQGTASPGSAKGLESPLTKKANVTCETLH